MKKLVLIFGVIFSFNTFADCKEGTDSCGTCGESCTWEKAGTTLTITGTGENATMDVQPWIWSDEHWTYDTLAPWGLDVTSIEYTGSLKNIGQSAFAGMKGVTSLTVGAQINTIGNWAFYGMKGVTDLTIGDSVTTIETGAFAWMDSVQNLVIPPSVTSIGNEAFQGMYLSSLIIEGTPSIGEGAFQVNPNAKIYCLNGVSCEGKGAENVTFYEKEADLYKIGDSYYATKDMMINDVTCSVDECQALLASKNAKNILFKGKFYDSLDDVANRNYVKHRIYTLEEANKVAGTKNRVSIKYR